MTTPRTVPLCGLYFETAAKTGTDYGPTGSCPDLTRRPSDHWRNVHRVKEMFFAYEQAVILHNEKRIGHHVYQRQHENKLRQFVEANSRRTA
jgi:hypothetical protein